MQEVGRTGLAVFFKGKEAGKNIMIRGDIDALPIHESSPFAYQSEHAGVSHKCGHDGHSTILLGLARRLSETPPARGEVCLLFQPAEEIGKGAEAVLKDSNFKFQADYAFALHNLPGFPLHEVICKAGGFTAAVQSVIFKLQGKTAHAAEPENGINPAEAISEILTLAKELSQKDASREDFALATLIHIHVGERAYGVSAGYGEIHFTLRAWQNEVMSQLDAELLRGVRRLAAKHGLGLDFEHLESFHATQNSDEAFGMIQKSAKALQLNIRELEKPFRFGEDFGLFTQKFSGAMFGLGAGESTAALHHPDYDFPDELIATGVDMFEQLIRNV